MSGKDALCSTLAAALLLLARRTRRGCRQRTARIAVTSSPRSPHRIAVPRCSAPIDAERTARGLPAVGESGQLSRAAQGHADDMVARRFFEHVTPGGSTLGDRVNATGYIDGPARLGARRGDRLGPAAARHARQPHARLAGQPRAPRDHPRPRFRDVGIGVTPGLTDGSANPGATAVLDFGFRTASPTLPRWRSATACARTASTSRQRPARCASTSTRSKLSTQAILRSSTPSATTWKVQLPMSPTTS